MNSGSVEKQRRAVGAQRSHLVLLGAGASLAAMPNGDKRGVKPPLLANFISALGLEPLLQEHRVMRFPDDFEKLCSLLLAVSKGKPRYAALLFELERRVSDYFAAFELPDEPTLYDHLLLSLRRKDTIATFNWDPLLVQAYERNMSRTDELPAVVFLHGCVAVGYCPEHAGHGGRPGATCPQCGRELVQTPLLYPVPNKDYLSNTFIAGQWSATRRALQEASLLTVFGYSGPRSDSDAVRLLRSAWSRNRRGEMLHVEVIDVKPVSEAEATWRPFFFSEHREVSSSFHDSLLGRYPRRSCEAAFWLFRLNRWLEPDSIPDRMGFDGLYEWLEPFMAAEREGEEVAVRVH